MTLRIVDVASGNRYDLCNSNRSILPVNYYILYMLLINIAIIAICGIFSLVQFEKPSQNKTPHVTAKPKSKRGGARSGAGRKPGVVSQAKLTLAEQSRAYGPDLIKALYQIAMDDEVSPNARVSAANSILDRAHGKPLNAMQLTGKDGGAIEHTLKARVVIVPPNEIAEVATRLMQPVFPSTLRMSS